MTTDQIINGLNYEIGMILFNPSTGESKEPEQLNVLDRASYEVCLAAIEALSAQVPRVMTLEEVKELHKYDDVYIERISSITGVHYIYAITVWFVFSKSIQFCPDNATLWFSEYGETWRCWTSRPTEEEREAVEWDE